MGRGLGPGIGSESGPVRGKWPEPAVDAPQAACAGEASCRVFELSFQVVRILLIFAILLFLHASADRLRYAQGHQWEQLRTELPRLLALRKLRWRLLLVYLVLPILIMFLEVQVRMCVCMCMWHVACGMWHVACACTGSTCTSVCMREHTCGCPSI